MTKQSWQEEFDELFPKQHRAAPIKLFITKLLAERQLAADELVRMLESVNHKYQGEDWQKGLNSDEQVIAALDTYHKNIGL